MFGRLFDKTLFAIFGIAYYWHVGKDISTPNVPNIAGFLFMWYAPRPARPFWFCVPPPCHQRFAVALLLYAGQGDCKAVAHVSRCGILLSVRRLVIVAGGCRVILPAYGAGPYLPAIVLERPVYIREMHDGLYTPATYLTYKACAQSSVWY